MTIIIAFIAFLYFVNTLTGFYVFLSYPLAGCVYLLLDYIETKLHNDNVERKYNKKE